MFSHICRICISFYEFESILFLKSMYIFRRELEKETKKSDDMAFYCAATRPAARFLGVSLFECSDVCVFKKTTYHQIL